mgnify:CR=1 FL=1
MKLTTCETVQLHNLKAEQVPVLMEKAIASEIYSRGGGGDNPRNIMIVLSPACRKVRHSM